jgi:hypothetical protein
VGALSGKVDFDDIAPYVGIGWDTTFGKDNCFGLVFELGVLYQGSPDVNLVSSGPIASDPTFQAELAKETAALQDDLDEYKFYPVVAVGLSYRF